MLHPIASHILSANLVSVSLSARALTDLKVDPPATIVEPLTSYHSIAIHVIAVRIFPNDSGRTGMNERGVTVFLRTNSAETEGERDLLHQPGRGDLAAHTTRDGWKRT